jgi:hypothetical protein
MSIFKDKNFKGEKYVDRDGYVMIRKPEHEKPLFDSMYGARGYGFEHRIAMAKKIGRPLTVHETVHHIDKKRQNNHPDNLEIHLRKYHHKHHIGKGDYKLFTKEYQPRYMKKNAMDSKVKRMLATLGGAAVGNIPAYLTYRKSNKVDNPEEAKGMKRRALEQAALGTLAGGFGGYTAGGFLGKGENHPFKNKDKKLEWNNLYNPDVLAGMGVGAGAGYLASREMERKEKEDDKERKFSTLKKILTIGTGAGIGAGAGKLNLLTR